MGNQHMNTTEASISLAPINHDIEEETAIARQDSITLLTERAVAQGLSFLVARRMTQRRWFGATVTIWGQLK